MWTLIRLGEKRWEIEVEAEALTSACVLSGERLPESGRAPEGRRSAACLEISCHAAAADAEQIDEAEEDAGGA